MKKFKEYINESRFDHLSEEEQIELVKKKPLSIMNIDKPSSKVQMAALNKKTDGVWIEIDDYCPEAQRLLLDRLTKCPRAAEVCTEVIPEWQWAIVKNNPKNIKYINNPDLDVQQYVLDKDPLLIGFIKNLHPSLNKYSDIKNLANLGLI